MSDAHSPAKTFEDLIVWPKAHQLTLAIYRYSRGFPKEERYGLTSQMRRATVSIAANIAEGFRRRGSADKSRMLNIAQASLEEVRYYLILARDLDYGDSRSLATHLSEVSRLLNAYTRTIRTNAKR